MHEKTLVSKLLAFQIFFTSDNNPGSFELFLASIITNVYL